MDAKRQVQKELFEEFTTPERKKSYKGMVPVRTRPTFSVSYEHVIFVIMGGIIIATAFFSLGVEKGKRIAAKEAQSPQERRASPVVQEPEEELIQQEPVQAEKPLEKAVVEAPAVPATVYTVMVASYAKRDTAEKEAALLKKKGVDGLVMASGRYLVVRVGNFSREQDADAQKKKLKGQYNDCYVKKIAI